MKSRTAVVGHARAAAQNRNGASPSFSGSLSPRPLRRCPSGTEIFAGGNQFLGGDLSIPFPQLPISLAQAACFRDYSTGGILCFVPLSRPGIVLLSFLFFVSALFFFYFSPGKSLKRVFLLLLLRSVFLPPPNGSAPAPLPPPLNLARPGTGRGIYIAPCSLDPRSRRRGSGGVSRRRRRRRGAEKETDLC